MHIIDYLKKHKMKVLDFASKMGVTTFSVYRWMNEGKLPRDGKIEKIKELSNGEITENDWGVHPSKRPDTSKCKAGSKSAGCNNKCSVESDEVGAPKV